MGYLHDWQPQRLSGIPGTRFFDGGHAGANGHNHFGFLKPEMAREAVQYLRGKGVQVTEWSADGGKVGTHVDPGHYDGRSFDVPASQWSLTPNRDKEIAGMRQVEEWMDAFLQGKGVPRAALSFLKETAPAGGQTYAAVSPPATTTSEVVERQVAEDWTSAASAKDRSTDPGSQGYWQRQDMRMWAEAHPELAKRAMANAGADPGWLQAPARTTVTETVETVQQPAAPQPAAPKPENRGALSGTRVGGPPPASLQPYSFEIHADQAAASGGQTGLIASYLDRDNPLFQRLAAAYGTYGENNSRQWRGGDLGAPKRGLSILETRTSGEGMTDARQQQTAAERLYQTVMADPEVKSGKRALHFFAGHGDVPAGGEMGAPGEKDWNLGVFSALRQRVQQDGRTNFHFHDPVVAGDEDPNANWNRAKALRDQWLQQQAGGQR